MTFSREHLRSVSRAVFGQHYRLELMLEVADSEDGIVCLTDLSKALDVTMSSLQRPFESLVASALISPLPDADSRFRYHTRNPSAAWDWAYELAGLTDRATQRGMWKAVTENA
jgi:hypothetical protein